MTRKLHILSSIGDVTDRKCWSGTPFAIWNAILQRRGGVETHNVMIGWRLQRVLGWANALFGLGAYNSTRVGLGHWLSVRRAQAIVDRSGDADDFLHFGSAHLPVKAKPGQRHWLFTDSSAFFDVANADTIAMSTERHRRALVAHELEMVARLDGVFVTADHVARSFVERDELPPEKVVAVKSGLGHVLPDPGPKDYAAGYILFIAKQNFLGKGGRLLLDAFDIVRRARPESQLVVIGNVDDPMQQQDLPRMRNGEGIRFYNYDTPDYRALLSGATLYAGPAVNEAWGIVYLESLTVRTPILGLAHNAYPQFARDGAYGFTAPEDTPEAIAKTLLDALSDPDRLARMGAAGREHVLTEYNWDRVADHILSRYPEAAE